MANYLNIINCAKSSLKWLGALGLCSALMSLSGMATAQDGLDRVRVSGTLYADAFVQDNAITEVELVDATMTLVDRSGVVVDTAQTALDGRFRLNAKPGDTYQICWEFQKQSACVTRVKVDKTPVFANRLQARLEGAYVYGRVLTGDLRPCWVQDSFFGLDVSTEVRGGGQQTRANTQGEYILLAPAGATFRVSTGCELAEAGQVVEMTTSRVRLDLNLGNRAPRITSIAATNGNKFVTRATMGETLKVVSSVRELDGDTVDYMWKLPEGLTGALSGSVSESEEWQLPNVNSRQSVYLMASDGFGGFSFKRFELQVGDKKIDASGIAADEITGAPIPNATVTLGNSTTLTDSNGWFALSAATVDDDRYVLNIEHPNFALVSRILDRSSAGNTYQLIRSQVTTHRGDHNIEIVDTRSAGACGQFPKGERPSTKRMVGLKFIYDEVGKDDERESQGKNRELEQEITRLVKRQSECDDRGIGIRIPAGSLVDAGGTVWTGQVRASIATLNPARRALPGDYQAITADGERAEMLSFGALYASFTDRRGRKLQLRPGALAEITTPISSFQRDAADLGIAQWSYDQKTGFWREEGKAELRETEDGPRYVGRTEHFSAINMDVAGTDPAFATCARVEIDAAFSAWSNLVLRSYVSYGGDSVQVKETALDNAQYHAIYRIPYGTGFPNTLRLELRGTLSGQEVLLLDDIINTDARPKMTGTDLWPPYPYTECGDPLLLTLDPGVIPPYGDFDATGRPSFLIGPYGAFNPVDGAQQAADYYAALDPAGDKDELGEWWGQNGFSNTGAGGVNQAYLNHNDLGFGRDMHCLENGNDLACYVSNYGLPDQNPNNADDAENKNPATAGATVTMEYDASAPVAERVQFFVFGGAVAASPRINFADLDGFGPKPVPFLCMVCHGGDSQLNANNTADFARFREFDLPSFRYSGNRSWDYGSVSLTPAELGNFAQLNEMVRATTGGTPIGSLIDAWYPGGFAGNPAPALPTPPVGWAANSTEYHEVYGKTCRTCHVARDEGNPNAFFVFNSYADLAGTDYSVCGSGNPKRRFMPNAVVTYKNFWADPARVLLYETMTSTAAGTCDN